MLLLTPEKFTDYELLDCGDFEKLERFGKYITIRPEPQAVWSRKWEVKEWEKRAHVRFVPKSSSAGTWKKLKDMPDQWRMQYAFNKTDVICFRLGLTSFKHVGIFPEQAVNWEYIYNNIKTIRKTIDQPRVLNLFAYTGGASLAAKAAGADITHLDSIKQVVTWAKENMELSHLDGIRWLVEDAMTYVKREVKRGKKYHGIILDPPAYGHGPDGEHWKLEEMINDMMKYVSELLEPENSFLVLNTYSLGFSSLIIKNLMEDHFGKRGATAECGEIYLQATSGVVLPLGVVGRI
ncbi:MAG: class I SAM-dependent methyltransferase [Bacteroidetes bacterium]|jgi:23S rRNA (cytosine1962-C5)-methyltransferase|nr:class I SAM-dependent methyltransferase [Bacteroidota bacterium]MBK9319210.1 class I SAM-dependent methyltransferase [Bacteroidota bacterium]